MRFLIVAAVLAYAAAAPAPEPGFPVGQRLEPTVPTISAGDINGAAIEAQVEVADNIRAAIDVDRQVGDKVAELEGQAINNAEQQAWRAVDAVKTVEARLDGAAANAASIIAKNLVRGVASPGVPYANPGAYAAPVVQRPASVARAVPAVQATAPIASVVAAPASYAAAPASYAAAPASYAAAPASYAAAPVAPVVQPAAPIDAVVEASAPITYAAAPAEYPVYPGYPGYPGYSGYSGYSGYPGSFLDSNPYIGNDFNQGFYPSPLEYAL